MDYGKLLGLVMAEAMELKKDAEDKKITVNELLGILSLAINKLELGDKVIIDLDKI